MLLKSSIRIATAACIAAAVLVQPALGQATSYEPSQQVEVREGDTWSKATVLAREGRRYAIRYDDGTEEWVTADRVRLPGAAGAPAAAGKAPLNDDGSDVDLNEKPSPNAAGAPLNDDGSDADPTAKPARKAPAAPEFKPGVGMKVQTKWGGAWRDSVVKKRAVNGWVLINYAPGSSIEWVEPWRIRKVGDDADDIPYARPNNMLHKMEAPPREAPGPKPDADAPFGQRNNADRTDPFAPKAYDKPVTEANTDTVQDLLATGGQPTLATFDGVPATQKLSNRSHILRGKGDRNSVTPDRLIFAGNVALLSYTGGGGGNIRSFQIERVDLATGNNLGAVDFDPLSNPIAIAPSGKRVLGVAHGFFGGTRNRVDLFDTAASGPPKHMVSFVPYGDDKNANDVDFAAFVDDEHVLTFSSGGVLTLWNAPKAAAVWRMNGMRGSVPAVSPGGKQVALMTAEGLNIIDALSGDALATVEGSRPVSSLVFTPDGKRVVGATGAMISQWDLATGQLTGDIGVAMGTGGLAGVGPNYVLLGNGDLLDLERKQTVWQYTEGGKTAGHGGRAWTVVKDGNRSVLVSADLPHPAAAKAAAAMGDTGLVVKPGEIVSLEVAIEGTEEQRQKIAAAITEQLKRSGIEVAEGRPVKLVARTEQGDTRTQTYERRNFGGFGPPSRETETVSVTEKITRVFFESNGKVLWENRTVSGTPWHVQSKEGQSIGQAVQAASQFNLAFLESVRVPAYVARPQEIVSVGKSRWSMGGVRDEK
ncbi:MAG TPA: hypothetical protein VGN72_12710 [Tepidisphaeraceae bacterium]|jgi:hypothetical protein|nr:hypothetical protein [Tepidisphaeraceae bacterium]